MTLTARSLGFAVSGTVLLSEVDIALSPGRLVAVTGPNGAGKSTLLSLLAGDLHPSAGRVTLDGRLLASWPRRALALRRAVLPQSNPVAFDFTVGDVVRLGRLAHPGRGETAADARVAAAALAKVGLAGMAERAYAGLSGGEQARAQLARVLAQVWDTAPGDPACHLLLDEATASLDAAWQHRTLGLARRFAERGAGVLAVIHDLSLASLYADRVVMVADGRVVADGPPDIVLSAERIARVFGVRVARFPDPATGRTLIAVAGATDHTA